MASSSLTVSDYSESPVGAKKWSLQWNEQKGYKLGILFGVFSSFELPPLSSTISPDFYNHSLTQLWKSQKQEANVPSSDFGEGLGPTHSASGRCPSSRAVRIVVLTLLISANQLWLGGRRWRILVAGLISSLHHLRVLLRVPRWRETNPERTRFCYGVQADLNWGTTDKDGRRRSGDASWPAWGLRWCKWGGRSSSRNHWRTSKFPGGSSENREFETESWQRTRIGKVQSVWPVTCSTAAPAWRWAFWLSAERSDCILKTWPQLVPSKDPWHTAVNQQTGHQGSLDILKMCFRYLGKSVDTFFQSPYRVGTTCGQRDMSGAASTHGTILFGSRGQSTTSLSLSCCLTQRWRKLETSRRCGLQAWESDMLGTWKPVGQQQCGSVHKDSLLVPEKSCNN